MADYIGSYESIPISGSIYDSIQTNMVYTSVMYSSGDLVTPTYDGIIEEFVFGGIFDNSNKYYDGFTIDDIINTNISEVIQPQSMVLTNVIYDYAERTAKVFNGITTNLISGILTTRFFDGYMQSGNSTEIKIIYRTVGSPRRSPLEAAWLRAKDAEGYVIDEVDGDIDE